MRIRTVPGAMCANLRFFTTEKHGAARSFKLALILVCALMLCFAACDTGGGNNDSADDNPVKADLPIEMVLIPGGTFTMGSPDDEGMTACISPLPMRTVIVTGFYMGKYTVMQTQYEKVMGSNPSYYSGSDKGNFPVEYVSWYDAVEFCNALSVLEGLTPAYVIDKVNKDLNNKNDSASDPKWTVTMASGADGYRLPTEAEWEYACKAGTNTLFSMGDVISSTQANIDNVRTGTIKVGSFAPNPWGLYDMHGNVWEWCWDWVYYGGVNYYDTAPDPDTNPTGLSDGNRRSERGGAWNRPPLRARSAYRERARPSARSNDLGFRVVRPL